MSASKRVQQWLTFTRQWYLFDAKWQDPFESAKVIVKALSGRHKPIHGGSTDCGDHVVVINSQQIALRGDEWYYRVYFHHTGYPCGGATWTKAWELHKKDPTMIMWKACYREAGNNLRRRGQMQRLHIFKDSNVPEDVIGNITDQIPQLRKVPKKLSEYSKEEIERFPKLFDYPQDYVVQ